MSKEAALEALRSYQPGAAGADVKQNAWTARSNNLIWQWTCEIHI